MEILKWSDRQWAGSRTTLPQPFTAICRCRFLRVVGLALAAACISYSQVEEYQMKALFLYNFARYVEWPAEAFGAPNAPIAICILGQNPFGLSLQQAIYGKNIEGRPLIVRQVSDAKPGCNCHILFVSASEKNRFRAVSAALRGSATLTVGETPGFTADGGVINFKMEEGKVRFEINVDAAGHERLRISSKLLRLAQIFRKPE